MNIPDNHTRKASIKGNLLEEGRPVLKEIYWRTKIECTEPQSSLLVYLYTLPQMTNRLKNRRCTMIIIMVRVKI